MGAIKLTARAVEKMWGRAGLPPGFAAGAAPGERTGEIWFEAGGGDAPALLVKYLFTSQRLSIQVHPDDDAARARGHARGKDEAWLILDAEPGGVIGLGLKQAITADALREAALDGSIEQLVDWKPVRRGDFFYAPAGTIHAIGAGVSLIEVQQNADITYRLYDYGRPRALQLDEALAAARLEPWTCPYEPRAIGPARELLATGGRFTVERWRPDGALRIDARASAILAVPLDGAGDMDGVPLVRGDVIGGEGRCALTPEGPLDLLVAYEGPVRLNLAAKAPQRGKATARVRRARIGA